MLNLLSFKMVSFYDTILTFLEYKDFIKSLGTSPTPTNYQPVPIHVGNIDHLMRAMDGDICPFQSDLRHKFSATEDWEVLNKKYQDILFPEMIEKWNADPETLDFTSSYQYIDNYYSAWFDQMNMPNKLSPEAKAQVDDILRDGLYEGYFGLDLAVRLATTKFFNFLHTTIERKIDAISNQEDAEEFYRNIKYMYLSAHDSSLSAIMSGLQQKQDVQVKFASNLRIELYLKAAGDENDLSNYEIKMLYNESPINVGNSTVCSEFTCPFQTVKDFLISREYDGDFDKTCALSDSATKWKAWLIVLLATGILIVVLCIVYFVFIVAKKKTKPEVSVTYNDQENQKVALNKSSSTVMTGEEQSTEM